MPQQATSRPNVIRNLEEQVYLKLPLSAFFRWGGVYFSCRVEQAAISNVAWLTIDADISVLPFSAENRQHREFFLSLMEYQPPAEVGVYSISEQNRIRLSSTTELALPVMGHDILKNVVTWILLARDYLVGPAVTRKPDRAA